MLFSSSKSLQSFAFEIFKVRRNNGGHSDQRCSKTKSQNEFWKEASETGGSPKSQEIGGKAKCCQETPNCSVGKSGAQDLGVTDEESRGSHDQKSGRRAVGRRSWTRRTRRGGVSYIMKSCIIYGFHPVIFCGIKQMTKRWEGHVACMGHRR